MEMTHNPKIEQDVLKSYSIWSEGFQTTGEHGRAVLHSIVLASSFQKACDHLAKKHREFAKYYDPNKLTYWGCRLYDNEEDAKKNFG